MTDFKLGDKVKFSNIVEKQRIQAPSKLPSGQLVVDWALSDARRPKHDDYKNQRENSTYTVYSEFDIRWYKKEYDAYRLPYDSYGKNNPDFNPNERHSETNSTYLWRDVIYDSGIITGKRHVSEYEIYPGDWEDPTVGMVRPGTTQPVYLVTYNLHRNPVMVFPKHLERIEFE